MNEIHRKGLRVTFVRTQLPPLWAEALKGGADWFRPNAARASAEGDVYFTGRIRGRLVLQELSKDRRVTWQVQIGNGDESVVAVDADGQRIAILCSRVGSIGSREDVSALYLFDRAGSLVWRRSMFGIARGLVANSGYIAVALAEEQANSGGSARFVVFDASGFENRNIAVDGFRPQYVAANPITRDVVAVGYSSRARNADRGARGDGGLSVLALNVESGIVRWRRDLDDSEWVAPTGIAVTGGHGHIWVAGTTLRHGALDAKRRSLIVTLSSSGEVRGRRLMMDYDAVVNVLVAAIGERVAVASVSNPDAHRFETLLEVCREDLQCRYVSCNDGALVGMAQLRPDSVGGWGNIVYQGRENQRLEWVIP